MISMTKSKIKMEEQRNMFLLRNDYYLLLMIENEEMIVLGFVGEKEVGKTSLLNKYIFGQIPQKYVSTLAVQFSTAVYSCNEGTKVRLKIWDSSGQQRYKGIIGYHLHTADGIFLVYDIGNSQSFIQIKEWVNRIKKQSSNQSNTLFMLIGNKNDKYTKRSVNQNDGKQLAKQLGCTYWQTSALTGQNIKKCFEQMVESILTQRATKRMKQIIQTQNRINQDSICGNCVIW